jgi:hypothetical protein
VEATKQEKERKEEKNLSPRNRKACHAVGHIHFTLLPGINTAVVRCIVLRFCFEVPVLHELLWLQDELEQHESGRGNKRARVTRGSRNPKHGKRKAEHCAQA